MPKFFWIFVTIVASVVAWLISGNWKIGAAVLIGTALLGLFSWRKDKNRN
jgi:uncharacterized membrane protein AbrB (regulator of aidB expression)